MTPQRWLEELLATDPLDPGCAGTFELLELYVEAAMAGRDPEREFPGVAAHLRSCPFCRQDYEGVLAAARE